MWPWPKKIFPKISHQTEPEKPDSIVPRREKTCLRGVTNNTGADQPAHPRSLNSAFVIRFLKRIICKLLQVKFQFSS